MAMQIASGSPHTLWAPVCGSSIPFAQATPILYVGQLVQTRLGGVGRLERPYGIFDAAHRTVAVAPVINADSTASMNCLFGLVIGTNNRSPKFCSTYNTEYIEYAAPYSVTSDQFMNPGGPWAGGEMRAMVKVALIGPDTIIRAPIYSNTSGTPTALTAQTITANASGRSATTATFGWTPGAAGFKTIYFRTGVAAGCYRITNDTSATVHTWREHLASTTGAATGLIGDTCMAVSLRAIGKSRMRTDIWGMWIDGGSSFTNYFAVNVLRLDLSVAGQEYAEFTFDGTHLNIGEATT